MDGYSRNYMYRNEQSHNHKITILSGTNPKETQRQWFCTLKIPRSLMKRFLFAQDSQIRTHIKICIRVKKKTYFEYNSIISVKSHISRDQIEMKLDFHSIKELHKHASLCNSHYLSIATSSSAS